METWDQKEKQGRVETENWGIKREKFGNGNKDNGIDNIWMEERWRTKVEVKAKTIESEELRRRREWIDGDKGGVKRRESGPVSVLTKICMALTGALVGTRELGRQEEKVIQELQKMRERSKKMKKRYAMPNPCITNRQWPWDL